MSFRLPCPSVGCIIRVIGCRFLSLLLTCLLPSIFIVYHPYLGGYPLLILVFGIECIVFYKSSKGLLICCRVTELLIIFFDSYEYMLFKRNFNIIISAITCFVERKRNGSAT